MTEKKVIQTPRRHIPLWVQILIWIGLLGLLGLLALGVLRGQSGIISVNEEVPDFTFTTFEGYEYKGDAAFNLSDHTGKVVLINFWASWCKPCESEAAELEAAWRQLQPNGEVVFLGVDYVDTEPEGRSYLAKFGISFPNGPDLGTRISQIFSRNLGVPETYIIDRQGILRYIKIGPFQSRDEILEAVESILTGG